MQQWAWILAWHHARGWTGRRGGARPSAGPCTSATGARLKRVRHASACMSAMCKHLLEAVAVGVHMSERGQAVCEGRRYAEEGHWGWHRRRPEIHERSATPETGKLLQEGVLLTPEENVINIGTERAEACMRLYRLACGSPRDRTHKQVCSSKCGRTTAGIAQAMLARRCSDCQLATREQLHRDRCRESSHASRKKTRPGTACDQTHTRSYASCSAPAHSTSRVLLPWCQQEGVQYCWLRVPSESFSMLTDARRRREMTHTTELSPR